MAVDAIADFGVKVAVGPGFDTRTCGYGFSVDVGAGWGQVAHGIPVTFAKGPARVGGAERVPLYCGTCACGSFWKRAAGQGCRWW
jgi:hypothetical protein